MTAVRAHGLHIHDSFTRSLRPFVPVTPGHVGIYVCGPTVYSDTHLGHAKSYVSFDVVVRYLRWLGFQVRYIQNITDVGHLSDNADEGEDKLERQARLDRVHPLELAETYTRLYFEAMDALGVRRPNISPRATQHIPEQLALIRRLIRLGHAYVVGGNVYFSVASFPDYGRLSGRTGEEAQEGHRVTVRSEKRDPRDFALWKSAEGGHVLRWETEWGPGYPGWHIECSAMASHYLGTTFDIHGGGLDNLFPHHECEIAQSRAAGHDFARYWMHNNLITVDGQKMSKSLGNFVTVADALGRHPAGTIRFWILSTHYRTPANYSEDGLRAAAAGRARLLAAISALDRRAAGTEPGSPPGFATALEAAFQKAMDEDFNTPLAIGALFEGVRAANSALAADLPPPGAAAAARLFRTLAGEVLGILDPDPVPATGPDAGPLIDLLLWVRNELKARREFALGDEIRTRLGGLGVEVHDRKDGSTWVRRDPPA
jgi:cysteinyl-tRNA synthetase